MSFGAPAKIATVIQQGILIARGVGIRPQLSGGPAVTEFAALRQPFPIR